VGVLVLYLLLSVFFGARPTGAADAPKRLPTLCIDSEAVSVSGVSSGAFFAHQFHVAHSARVMGAAIFAGGPYLCAGDNFPQSLFRSLNVCSDFSPGPFLGPPDAERSIAAARTAAAAGGIDRHVPIARRSGVPVFRSSG
jgi:poly(3-hydroxybutyrate) depolymerase